MWGPEGAGYPTPRTQPRVHGCGWLIGSWLEVSWLKCNCSVGLSVGGWVGEELVVGLGVGGLFVDRSSVAWPACGRAQREK